MNCTNCGIVLPARAAHCPACGQAIAIRPPIPAATAPTANIASPPLMGTSESTALVSKPMPSAVPVFCVQCGTTMPPEVTFCPSCGAMKVPLGAEVRRTVSARTDNKATIVLIAEIVGGYIGFLGFGHIYSGRWPLGVGLLLLWWFILGPMLIGVFASGGLLACIALPVWFGVPIFSGIMARKYVLSKG